MQLDLLWTPLHIDIHPRQEGDQDRESREALKIFLLGSQQMAQTRETVKDVVGSDEEVDFHQGSRKRRRVVK